MAPILDPAPAGVRPSLPLPALASQVTWLEPEASLFNRFPVHLGQSVTQHLNGSQINNFRPETVSGPIRSYRLQNVLLDASIMGLYQGRYPIRDTLYLVTEDQYEYALVKPIRPVATDSACHHVVATTIALRNYYHWMVQALPTIDWCVRQPSDRRVVLALPALEPWQEQSLALLGHDRLPRLTLDFSTTYHLASAEYAEFLNSRLPFMVSLAAAATFARLRAAVTPAEDGAPVIYVARTDATNRVMENEAALIDMLRRRSVQIVEPGALPVARQLALFRKAQLVIGPHGAGLSNIVGCAPGAHLYELLPSHYPNHCFSRLAQTCGLQYWADVFRSADGDASPHQRRWQVDLDVVAAQLDMIRATIAPRAAGAMDTHHADAVMPPRPIATAVQHPAL